MPRVQVLYTHPTPQSTHLCSREHFLTRFSQEEMFFVVGALRFARAVHEVEREAGRKY